MYDTCLSDRDSGRAHQRSLDNAALLEYVRREHTMVKHYEPCVAGKQPGDKDYPKSGFGVSDRRFTPWNYRITTTPREEFDYAYLEPNDPKLPALTLGERHRRSLGKRLDIKKDIHWKVLADPEKLCERINVFLKDLELDYDLTVEEVKDANIWSVELMLITMYTGPMFE